MEYELVSSLDEGILKITLTGKVNRKKSAEIVSRVTDLIKTLQPKSVLIDAQLVQEHLDLFDSYNLVHSYPQEIPRLRTAIIDRIEDKTISNFYETVMDNAGYIARYFTDETAARAWLVS
jgi:hypothetical protein